MSGRDFNDVGKDWPDGYGGEAIRAAIGGARRVWSGNPDVQPLPTVRLVEWAGQSPPAREWMVKDWIPLREATLLTGRGGVGKSLLAQQLCTCVAAGLPFLGSETRHGAALYVTCEDDTDELWRRQQAINSGLGVKMADLIGRLELVSLAGQQDNHLATFDLAGRLEPSPRWEQLTFTALEVGAGIIALDNASHFMVGDHNSLAHVTAFLNLLNGLASGYEGSVLLMHHPNKAGDDWLGSVAWENQVRSRIFMAGSEIEGDPDARSISNPKANYAPSGGRVDFRWFKGSYVRDDDLPDNMAEEIAANAMANADNATFLACLAERTRQRRAVSEKLSPTFAPAVFAKMPEAKGVGKRRLEAAMDRLFRIGAVERAQLWIGTDRKPVFGLRETAGNAAGNGAGDARGTRADIEAGNGAGNAGDIHTISKDTLARPLGAAAPSDSGGAE